MSSGPIRSSSFPAHEIEAIKGLYPPWKACLLEQDFEGVASFYTEDAVVMPPNQPTIRGRAEVKSWLESFPKVTEAESGRVLRAIRAVVNQAAVPQDRRRAA